MDAAGPKTRLGSPRDPNTFATRSQPHWNTQRDTRRRTVRIDTYMTRACGWRAHYLTAVVDTRVAPD